MNYHSIQVSINKDVLRYKILGQSSNIHTIRKSHRNYECIVSMAFLIYASFSKVLSVSFDLYGHSFTEEADVNRID